jgi:probable HAF family extracellular repeat protein
MFNKVSSKAATASTRSGWSKPLRAAALFSVCVCATSTASAQWTITDLGDLPGGFYSYKFPKDINDAGQVVGNVTNARGTISHAFLWQNGVMTNLGDLPGGADTSVAFGINNSGQVVGWSGAATGIRAFLWQNGVMSDLGDLPGGTDLSIARGINDAGQVVGESSAATGVRPFLWQNGVMTNLGDLPGHSDYSTATGINNAGQVVGYSPAATGTRPFLWQNGVMTDLGDLTGGGEYAFGINDAGQGVSSTGGRAFLWQNGYDTDLSTVSGVVDTGWRLTNATAINNAGQIVGYGTNPQGLPAAYILTPVPEPEVYLMIGVGVCLAGVIARRRKQID